MPADVQHFLARLYTDPDLLERFLESPLTVAGEFGFSAERAREIAAIDRDALRIAAHGFAQKRLQQERLGEVSKSRR